VGSVVVRPGPERVFASFRARSRDRRSSARAGPSEFRPGFRSADAHEAVVVARRRQERGPGVRGDVAVSATAAAPRTRGDGSDIAAMMAGHFFSSGLAGGAGPVRSRRSRRAPSLRCTRASPEAASNPLPCRVDRPRHAAPAPGIRGRQARTMLSAHAASLSKWHRLQALGDLYAMVAAGVGGSMEWSLRRIRANSVTACGRRRSGSPRFRRVAAVGGNVLHPLLVAGETRLVRVLGLADR